nr:CopD family protein [uncultured Halomonas sp.]
MPIVDMTWLAAVRSCHVAGLGVGLGSALLTHWRYAADAPAWRRDLERLTHAGLCISLLSLLLWWPLLTRSMTGADSLADALPDLSVVLLQTHVGATLSWRFALLVLAWLLWWLMTCRWQRSALGLIAVGLMALVASMTPLLGHGAAVPWPTRTAMMLHVLAGLLWLGCLPGLLAAYRRCRGDLRPLLLRFSTFATACVVLLAAAGLLQSLVLIGDWSALFGSTYGHLVILKAGAFVALLGIGALNRWLWTPRSDAGAPQSLGISLAIEIAVGMSVLVVAALVVGQPPPGHWEY